MIILNCLKKKERMVMLYRMADISQTEIAEKMKISQSYVSIIEKRAQNKIREKINSKIGKNKEFSVYNKGGRYIISFSPRGINKKNLKGKKYKIHNEQVLIEIKTNSEFEFIAELIQE